MGRKSKNRTYEQILDIKKEEALEVLKNQQT